MPAEWEPQSAVLVAWPHSKTDWVYMLDKVCDCYEKIVLALQQNGLVTVVFGPELDDARRRLERLGQSVVFAEIPTNDTWVRDYGPITTVDIDGRYMLNDFVFNGWGMKFAANLDNMANRHLSAKALFGYAMHGDCRLVNNLDFVLEGGSVESDGHGTLMTSESCLLAPNRNDSLTKAEIEAQLCRRLGADRVLWVSHGGLAGDDTDGHIDTLARLAPHGTIIYTGCTNPDDEHYDSLQLMARQLAGFRTADNRPYNLIELPLPDPIYDDNGNRLPATYANYLVTPAKVLMPTYGQARKDMLAAQMLRIVYCDREVIGVDCRALIQQHGSLHCATMQLP